MDDIPPQTTTTVPPNPPASTPTTDNNPPPPPHPSTLQALRIAILRSLKSTLHASDRTLLRLAKLLSSPSSTDTLLCTTSYTLTLLHTLLSRLLHRRLTSIASDIASKADGILLPGETLIASLPAPTSTKLIAHIIGSSKALAGTIADYRIFVRLWGLVGLYTWARSTYLSPLPPNAPTKEKSLRSLTWCALASCVGFQVLENGAYLSSKGALTTASWAGEQGKARENAWWLWSSRFWAAYVGVELTRLGVEWYYHEPPAATTTPPPGGDGEKEDKLRLVDEQKQQALSNWMWWKDLASNAAYAPMTIHWSLPNGLLSDWGVGACGIVAGGANLADAWRRTA